MPSPITITISGLSFDLTPPFEPGHQCNGAEAAVLNQAWVDNIRTNFAKRVQAVGFEDYPSELADQLKAEFAEYVAGYSFKSSGPRKLADPVEREARALAKSKVTAYVQSQGRIISELDPEKLDTMISRVMALPEIQEEAERRVKALTAVADDIFDLSGESAA